jgi:hypothetical protein
MEKSLTVEPGSEEAKKELPRVAESYEENPESWFDFWSGKTRVCPIKGLSPFEQLLAVRLFGDLQRLPDAVAEFCRQELGENSVQPRTVDTSCVFFLFVCLFVCFVTV